MKSDHVLVLQYFKEIQLHKEVEPYPYPSELKFEAKFKRFPDHQKL